LSAVSVGRGHDLAHVQPAGEGRKDAHQVAVGGVLEHAEQAFLAFGKEAGSALA